MGPPHSSRRIDGAEPDRDRISGGLCPALQYVSPPSGPSTPYIRVTNLDSMPRRYSARFTRLIVSDGESLLVACAEKIPCIIALSRAAGGPLPATSPSANPSAPRGRST